MASEVSGPYVLPQELFDGILQLLSCDDICNLRLTSSRFKAVCHGPRFESMLAHQTVYHTPQGFERLRYLPSLPEVSSSIRSLRLVAVLHKPDTRDWIHSSIRQQQNHLTLPQAADEVSAGIRREAIFKSFIRMYENQLAEYNTSNQDVEGMIQTRDGDEKILKAAFRAMHSLKHIGLHCQVSKHERIMKSAECWPYSAPRAALLLTLTALALKDSRLDLSSLDIFGQMNYGGVAMDDLMAISSEFATDISSRITKLTTTITPCADIASVEREKSDLMLGQFGETPMHTSIRYRDFLRDDEPAVHSWEPFVNPWWHITAEGRAIEQNNSTAPSKFLSHFPNLIELDLNLRFTPSRREGIRYAAENGLFRPVFTELANHTVFPHLCRCTLRGLWTDANSLHKFLANHSQLEELSLFHAILPYDAAWEPILEHIKQMPHLQLLRLSELYIGEPGQILGYNRDYWDCGVSVYSGAEIRQDPKLPLRVRDVRERVAIVPPHHVDYVFWPFFREWPRENESGWAMC